MPPKRSYLFRKSRHHVAEDRKLDVAYSFTFHSKITDIFLRNGEINEVYIYSFTFHINVTDIVLRNCNNYEVENRALDLIMRHKC